MAMKKEEQEKYGVGTKSLKLHPFLAGRMVVCINLTLLLGEVGFKGPGEREGEASKRQESPGDYRIYI